MYVRLLKIGSNTWNKGTNMKKIEFEKKMEAGPQMLISILHLITELIK